MTAIEIGKFIRLRRESLNLRQEDLSEMSSVTTRTIHQVESGKGNPSIQTLEKLAIILGLELIIQVRQL